MSRGNSARRPGPLRRLLGAPLFSPAGFLARAALVSLAYFAAHLGGLRTHTSFLSGTSPTAGGFERTPLVLGGLYLLLHFAFTVLVPVLVLAAGIFGLWNRLADRRGRAD